MQMGWFCHSMEKILLLVFKTGFLGLQWLSLFFLSRGLARPFSTSFCCFMLLHISGLGSSYLCLRVIVFFGPVFSQNKFIMPLCHISVIFPYQITLTKLLCRFFFLCWLNHLVQRQFPLAIQSYQHVSWALFAPTPFPPRHYLTSASKNMSWLYVGTMPLPSLFLLQCPAPSPNPWVKCIHRER